MPTPNARGRRENNELSLISLKCIFQLFGEEALLPNLDINGRAQIIKETSASTSSNTITSCVEEEVILYLGKGCIQDLVSSR